MAVSLQFMNYLQMNKRGFMKKHLFILMILSLSVFTSAHAGTGAYFCDGQELKDSKSKEVVREFEREDECVETLSFSENNKYCESRQMKDLKTGATIQSFGKSRDCDEALFTKVSKN